MVGSMCSCYGTRFITSEGKGYRKVIGRRERGLHMAAMGSPYDGGHLERSEGLWVWRTSRGEQREVPETELPDGAALDRGSYIPRSLFEFGQERQTLRQQEILGSFGHEAGDSKLQVSGKLLRVP